MDSKRTKPIKKTLIAYVLSALFVLCKMPAFGQASNGSYAQNDRYRTFSRIGFEVRMMGLELGSLDKDMTNMMDELGLSSHAKEKTNPDKASISKANAPVAAAPVVSTEIPHGFPVKGSFRISSEFGYRSDPFHGRRTFHRGIDIPLRTGTSIYATGRGSVVEAGFHRGLGNYIKIRHADGYESIYAHLSRIHVRRGQAVKSGQHIGNSGNTGRSTGPHLHYQVNLNGRAIDPVELINRMNTAQNE